MAVNDRISRLVSMSNDLVAEARRDILSAQGKLQRAADVANERRDTQASLEISKRYQALRDAHRALQGAADGE